ncbi:MAG: type II toxin-antitoxin system PemK/MazF family toxin [Rhodospirillaceae bacterium]|nr:type II toxin-antitoxin system PemK/MazF family toxin [Rhodospirillaceae bacterium]
MPIPPPRVGSVIRFNYIWHHEHRRGHDEGKERPVALVLAYNKALTGEVRVVVLPITHRKPDKEALAVRIPDKTKRLLGLDGEQSWIICDEANDAEWPGYDLRPVPGHTLKWEYGLLGQGLYNQARTLFVNAVKARRLKKVKRD